MKKILVLLFVTISITTWSQEVFTLIPEGFSDVENDNNYLVVSFPNMNQNDLYKKSLIYFKSIYKNPDRVINSVENELINLSGYASNVIKKSGLNRYNLKYNLIFKFKDGKVKIEEPSVEMTNTNDPSRLLFISYHKFSIDGSRAGIYGKKGKLKSKKAKESLENYINSFITSWKDNVLKKDSVKSKDDW